MKQLVNWIAEYVRTLGVVPTERGDGVASASQMVAALNPYQGRQATPSRQIWYNWLHKGQATLTGASLLRLVELSGMSLTELAREACLFAMNGTTDRIDAKHRDEIARRDARIAVLEAELQAAREGPVAVSAETSEGTTAREPASKVESLFSTDLHAVAEPSFGG